MKKTLITVAAIIVVAGIGGGGYALLSHKNNKNTSSNNSSSNSSQTVAASTKQNKQLNLNLLLTNLKAKYPTVQQSYVYTASMDPNNELGKAGGYTAGAEFYDTRTGYTPADDGSAAFGAECGGAIEVYPTPAAAAKRVAYLQQFQSDPTLNPGAVKQVNNVVVRASNDYTGTEQTDMINYLASQVQAQLQ